MAIAIVCGSCGKRYEVAETMAGKRAKCKCGQAIEIPLPQPEVAPLGDLLDDALLSAPGLPASESKLANLPLPAAQPLAAAPTPVRRRGKSGGNTQMLLIAGGVGAGVLLLMAIVGGLAVYFVFFRAPRYSTPEAAFNALRDAAVAKNWKRMLGVLTPESQDMMVGMMTFGAIMESKSDPKTAEILKQHGVDPNQFQPGAFNFAELAELMRPGSERMKQVLGPIKNKPAFFAAIMSHMDSKKDAEAKARGVDRDDLAMVNADAKLTDVKIDGDTARGRQSGGFGNQSIAFKKIDGGWRIDLIGSRPF
jgi:hypothetical protein